MTKYYRFNIVGTCGYRFYFSSTSKINFETMHNTLTEFREGEPFTSLEEITKDEFLRAKLEEHNRTFEELYTASIDRFLSK